MGTVHAIRQEEAVTLGGAAAAYLAVLDHPESQGTRKVYGSTLRALRAEFGDGTGGPRSRPARSPRGSPASGGRPRQPRGTGTWTRSGPRSGTGKIRSG